MVTACASLREIGQTDRARANEPVNDFLCKGSKRLHRHQHAMERAKLSYASDDRTFREKSSAALKRRLFPNSNLTTKQLAYALRISEPTIWNLLSGNNDPSGRVFSKLVEFFGAQFLHEIFGGPNIHVIDPRDSRKADALRRMAEAQEELRRLG
jgi:transcriptional regulator with XRE-family HTH domain